jgi:alpha-L-fucosidase
MFWCDGEIGSSRYFHDDAVFAYYYNQARRRGQDVAVNDRCKVAPQFRSGGSILDYTTPEYSTYSKTMPKKWEASRGMGFSYGYNANERPKDYQSAQNLIRMLVDMVSKNGNLLLDIGPKADGTIPEIMQERLLEMGRWLRVNGEAIYSTQYWWRTPQDGSLRFTVAPNRAFYVISLARPGAHIVVHAPVPIRGGDKIMQLGWNGGALAWHKANGSLVIDVPQTARRSGYYAWVYKIAWH